ncbi:hypothetical protein OCS_01305 [Ophiocordyceps sinensis CO18]|uniref:Uncharacterized protein n=1 Tax=Ophiocordyceps sinensis (strain Co18 / CGMCC 3.14243) TaxID=911162 RepID=T5AKM6_OPHSC|nr:hypothetical protein OCS_01305 [Ophiocordyceps sinensis CO18]
MRRPEDFQTFARVGWAEVMECQPCVNKYVRRKEPQLGIQELGQRRGGRRRLQCAGQGRRRVPSEDWDAFEFESGSPGLLRSLGSSVALEIDASGLERSPGSSCSVGRHQITRAAPAFTCTRIPEHENKNLPPTHTLATPSPRRLPDDEPTGPGSSREGLHGAFPAAAANRGFSCARFPRDSADLGRARQDELPLSNRELHGPSFLPTRNNTARHIPAAYRENLKSKWSVQIRDEEAAQIDGLANDDARPWATKRGLDIRPPEIPASRPLQAHSGNSKRPVFVASKAPVGRLGGLIPPGTPSKASSPQIKPDGLENARVSPAALRKPVPAQAKPTALDATSKRAALGATPKPAALDATPKPTALAGPPKKPPVPPHKSVCSGNCQLQSAAGTSPVMVQFDMRINNVPPGAALIFVFPGNDRKVYDIQDLKVPVTDDQCCVVASNDGNTKYRVNLETIELTREFNKYLECLRRLVMMQNERNARAGISNPPVSKGPSTPVKPDSTQVTTQRAACPQEVERPVTAGLAIGATERPVTAGLAIGATGNAQERLYRLIHRLVPGFAGCQLSDKEAERFNGDYLNMIKTLEGIERQLKPESPSSCLASLKELEVGQNPTPLRYTLDEMKSLNTHATLRTKQQESLSIKALMAGNSAAKSAMPAKSATPAKLASPTQLPNFAECRDWLFGSSTNVKPLAKTIATPTQQSIDAVEPLAKTTATPTQQSIGAVEPLAKTTATPTQQSIDAVKPLAKTTAPPTQQSIDAASSTFPPARLGWETLCDGAVVSSSEPMEIDSPPAPKAVLPASKLATPAAATSATKPGTTKAGPLHKVPRPGLSTSRWA